MTANDIIREFDLQQSEIRAARKANLASAQQNILAAARLSRLLRISFAAVVLAVLASMFVFVL